MAIVLRLLTDQIVDFDCSETQPKEMLHHHGIKKKKSQLVILELKYYELSTIHRKSVNSQYNSKLFMNP